MPQLKQALSSTSTLGLVHSCPVCPFSKQFGHVVAALLRAGRSLSGRGTLLPRFCVVEEPALDEGAYFLVICGAALYQGSEFSTERGVCLVQALVPFVAFQEMMFAIRGIAPFQPLDSVSNPTSQRLLLLIELVELGHPRASWLGASA